MKELKEKNESMRAAMRYAGLGTQMLVLLGLGVWGGHKLDARMHLKALFVIIFPVIALGFSLYSLIRSLNQNKK